MLSFFKLFSIAAVLITSSQTIEASLCEPYIQQQEVLLQIPSHLLKAIAHTESGHLVSPSKIVAWPWTINVNGKGYVYSTKKEAIDAVKKFQRTNANSIDVGCMQINMKHHPKAFQNLSDAFDPQKNVTYAAKFLKGLKNQYGSWHNAVAHYHSATPKYHNPYREKVTNRWQKIRKQNGNLIPVWQDTQFLMMSPMQQTTSSKPVLPKSKHETPPAAQLTLHQQYRRAQPSPVVQRVQFPANFIPLNAHDNSGSVAVVNHKHFYPLNANVEVSGSGRVFYPLYTQ
jgi:hypothetical protein